MKVTLRTRKPCDKLKVSDFRAFPIWEFALGEEGKPGRDETWVRPLDCAVVPKDEYSLLVAAIFTTSAGKKLNGYMIVTTANKKIEINHAIALGRLGYQSIPMKSTDDWSIRTRKELVKAIGQPESRVFPIKYTLKALIHGEKAARQGMIK